MEESYGFPQSNDGFSVSVLSLRPRMASFEGNDASRKSIKGWVLDGFKAILSSSFLITFLSSTKRTQILFDIPRPLLPHSALQLGQVQDRPTHQDKHIHAHKDTESYTSHT
jgi:hypothetical protein